MSNKSTCPACDSHTSAIWEAFERGAPCPYCGLPADVAVQVDLAAQRGADAGLQRRFVEAERRTANAEAEVRRLRRKVSDALRALRAEDNES